MTSLGLIAASRAEEAGYLALADIAHLAAQTGIDYRIVGGQMVSLHVAASGADDPALRQTLDADLCQHPPPRRSHLRQLRVRRENCRAELLKAGTPTNAGLWDPVDWGNVRLSPYHHLPR
jgi:hypothetical protein